MVGSIVTAKGRTCRKCGKWKRASSFLVRIDCKGGLYPYCRTCENTRHLLAGRTPTGRAMQAWHNILIRAGNRKSYLHVEVRTTRDEFLRWAIPAFEEWMSFNPTGIPSVDRIDAAKHYEISNLRVLSLEDNARTRRNAYNTHAPTGQAWCSCCQQYLQIKNFNTDKNRSSGVRGYCKQCRALKHKTGVSS